jgi:hypothetical protein
VIRHSELPKDWHVRWAPPKWIVEQKLAEKGVKLVTPRPRTPSRTHARVYTRDDSAPPAASPAPEPKAVASPEPKREPPTPPVIGATAPKSRINFVTSTTSDRQWRKAASAEDLSYSDWLRRAAQFYYDTWCEDAE